MRFTPWRTVATHEATTDGGELAERWLLRPCVGLTEKRLKIGSGSGGYILTREECRSAHAQAATQTPTEAISSPSVPKP